MIDWPKDQDMSIGWREKYFFKAIQEIKPKTYCEIGCHTGRHSASMLMECLKYTDQLKFIGYDLFDLANEQTHKQEINGKGPGNYQMCVKRMERIKKTCSPVQSKYKKYPNKKFTYELHKGFTQDTLKTNSFDLVFIDGGHSYDTVKHDYEKLKNSKIIFFDDYDIPDVQKFCDEIGAINLIPWKSKKKIAVICNEI